MEENVLRKTIILLMIFLIAGLSSCVNDNSDDLLIPNDFNFSISFGINGYSKIDTYNGTFTKDLVKGGTETIPFIIPVEQMQEIYNAFMKFHVSELPDDINEYAMESIGENWDGFIPASNYTLTYTKNQETRTIVCYDGGPWDVHKGPPDAYKQLRQFVDFVCEYI